MQETGSHARGWCWWAGEWAECCGQPRRERALQKAAFQQPSSLHATPLLYSFLRKPHFLKVRTKCIFSRDGSIHATSCNSQSSSSKVVAPRQLFVNLAKCWLNQKLAQHWCWTKQKLGGKEVLASPWVPATGQTTGECCVIPELLRICGTIQQIFHLTNFLSFHSF